MSHGGLKRARSRKRRIQPKEAYSSPGLLYSEACDMAGYINSLHQLTVVV
jgi:hypothetical protein